MRLSRFILCKIWFYGSFMKMNEESYLDLSLTKVAKRCNHLDLSAFFFRTNSYGNPYEFYFDEIRTKNPYEFFWRKTYWNLSVFNQENRKDNSYGFFKENTDKFVFFSLGKPYGKFVRIFSKKKNVQLSLLFTKKTVQTLCTDFFEGKT